MPLLSHRDGLSLSIQLKGQQNDGTPQRPVVLVPSLPEFSNLPKELNTALRYELTDCSVLSYSVEKDFIDDAIVVPLNWTESKMRMLSISLPSPARPSTLPRAVEDHSLTLGPQHLGIRFESN